MTTTLVDFSFTHPSPRAVKAAGHSGVICYLGGTSNKRLTRSEAKAYLAAGLGILHVFEGTAQRAVDGYGAGVADAKTALSQARALGYPDGCPIFFAVDFDAQWAQVAAYFHGVRSILGVRAGVYGGIRITRAARAAGFRYTWQTCAWSGREVDNGADLYQRLSATRRLVGYAPNSYDEDVLLKSIPLWVATQKKPAPAPKPPADPYPGWADAETRKAFAAFLASARKATK